ncbi:hypothetical protein SUGI_0743880 [Cryptomeria japonica]|nr:hypothetical protein SUGI_0743880 [Cryptomeria japonica]
MVVDESNKELVGDYEEKEWSYDEIHVHAKEEILDHVLPHVAREGTDGLVDMRHIYGTKHAGTSPRTRKVGKEEQLFFKESQNIVVFPANTIKMSIGRLELEENLVTNSFT